MYPVPIIVNASGNIYFYTTQDDAELDMEPLDVRNDYYTVYDGTGRRLTLAIVLKPVRIFCGLCTALIEHTVITGSEPHPTHAAELRQALVAYYELVGLDRLHLTPATLQSASLADLVQRGLTYLKPIRVR